MDVGGNKIQRTNILGVGVSSINMGQAIETIQGWIDNREPHYVCVTPAHSIMECYNDPALRPIFNHSGLTTPDGMSIVWLLKLNGHRHVERVYGPDLMHAVCKHSLNHGYRHYFYGGTPGVVEDLETTLKEQYPGLKVVGSYSPPFGALDKEEEDQITDHIKTANPDILWVGISSPRQEIWMAEHLSTLNVPVLIGVGAAFDFLSGRKPQAPKWMQRSGLEWLFRLTNEPGRLWRRYLRYPLFLFLVIAQLLGLKKYTLE
ncbi:MAG: WecB/TagA/CpsF family glycosyltransferase [Anaerolineales bacterium]|nr:WecB/TagA/CpsF family glycosyltransferase [Anaerolineales bacterium]